MKKRQNCSNVCNGGDPLEIFTDREGQIILKKYSPIGEMTTFDKRYAESLAQVSGRIALISDRDQFIAVCGGYKNLLGKSLSREMEEKMNDREVIVAVRGGKEAGSLGSRISRKTNGTIVRKNALWNYKIPGALNFIVITKQYRIKLN